MSPSTQPPPSPRSTRSTRPQAPNLGTASLPTTPSRVTTTYQIGSLKAHRGRRNLTSKKRSHVSENEDAHPTKKRKAQERVHPPFVPSPTASAAAIDPSKAINQGRSKVLATPNGDDINLASQIPARSHGPNSQVLVDHSQQPRPTAILMLITSAESSREKQSAPLVITSRPQTDKLHSVTRLEYWVTPTQHWNSVPEATLASSNRYNASRMLPRLIGLDSTLPVDFNRHYGPEQDHPSMRAHPQHIAAGFKVKPLDPLTPTWNQLPSSASTLEPSRFYSPVKHGFESNIRLPPLLLPEGPYFAQSRISTEQQQTMSNPRFLNRADGGLSPMNAHVSTSPNHGLRPPQSSLPTNNTHPERSHGLHTPGLGHVSNFRTILPSNPLSGQDQAFHTNSTVSHSGNHRSVTHQRLDRNQLFDLERARLDHSPSKGKQVQR